MGQGRPRPDAGAPGQVAEGLALHLPREVETVTSVFLAEADARAPGLLTGLFLHGSLGWGEFHPGSDVDFIAVWSELPHTDLLRAIHEATRARYDARPFDGSHVTAADLAGSPELIAHRPGFLLDEFLPEGRVALSLVTWHELAERAVVVRGELPPVHTDPPRLLELTRANLATYWRDQLRQVDEAGPERFGGDDRAVAWVALGAPRLHHLLTTGAMTSKSGGGRHVLDHLDPRFHPIAREALRVRERPADPSAYDDSTQRGRDARDLLAWTVADVTAG